MCRRDEPFSVTHVVPVDRRAANRLRLLWNRRAASRLGLLWNRRVASRLGLLWTGCLCEVSGENYSREGRACRRQQHPGAGAVTRRGRARPPIKRTADPARPSAARTNPRAESDLRPCRLLIKSTGGRWLSILLREIIRQGLQRNAQGTPTLFCFGAAIQNTKLDKGRCF